MIDKSALYTIQGSLKKDFPSLATINEKDANFQKSENYELIWEVQIDLYDDVKSEYLIEDVSIYICFTSIFPYEPPKIHISRDWEYQIGVIPHVSYGISDVCLFDEFVITDYSNPEGIIRETIDKAKLTLEEGLTKTNIDDFSNEFLAYWERQTWDKDKVLSVGCYSIIKDDPDGFDNLEIIEYHDEILGVIKFIIYNKQEDSIKKFIDYFKTFKIVFKKHKVFYIGDLSGEFEIPPFKISNFKSLEYITDKQIVAFKQFINAGNTYVFFKKNIGGSTQYLGWKYTVVKKKISGFRKLNRYKILFSESLPFHKNLCLRLSTEKLIEERLFDRTSGHEIESHKFSFGVVGLGSVGSYLLTFLNNYDNPNFTLIDHDTLKSDNLARHFLGFNYLNHNKAAAFKNYLLERFPSQSVQSFPSNILQVNLDVLNSQDFIFFCVGKQNLDKWLLNKVRQKEVKKPVFILWVEPYLIGGQLVFIHPEQVPNETDLYYDTYKYKYSVISPEEFENKRDLFIKKESGCQSVYSPYTSDQLILFLSAAFGKISWIINNDVKESISYSWTGDEEISKKLNVKRETSGSFLLKENYL